MPEPTTSAGLPEELRAAPSRHLRTVPFDPHVREASTITSLRRRMENGTMTDRDLAHVQWSRVIRQMRSEGKTWEVVAGMLGQDVRAINRYGRSPTHRFLVRCFDAERIATYQREGDSALELARQGIEGLAKVSEEFLAWCFRKNDKGEWADPDLAMWATDRVQRTTGLDKPRREGGEGERPITIESMTVIMGQTDADDAAIARMHTEAVTVEVERVDT